MGAEPSGSTAVEPAAVGEQAPVVGDEIAARSHARTGARPRVCVQGLGFVGTAMALATASARDADGAPCYDVVGVELGDPAGRERAQALNEGRLPIASADARMAAALDEAMQAGNLAATTDPVAYTSADVSIVDIPLDLTVDERASVDFTNLRAAVRELASRMPAGSLIIIETTVPPGTCEHVIAPEIERELARRGLAPDAILLAHAYERVMPGADYLDSIVNFWRVFSGRTPAATEACERFLCNVVNVDRYPLTRLGSTTASETAKVLENSYRAVTIALMEEWGRFAESVGIDLFEVITAIRRRPTHSNIRQPGFGVGGYCLTKDPLFAEFGARELFQLEDVEFAFSRRAVELNRDMPLVTLDKVDELLEGLAGRRLLLLGISYREGVGDTRHSPSRVFVAGARDRGADVVAHDPMIRQWSEQGTIPAAVPDPAGFDAVVFAVPHAEYRKIDVRAWLRDARPLVFDANNVLTVERLREVAAMGSRVWSIGRGWVTA